MSRRSVQRKYRSGEHVRSEMIKMHIVICTLSPKIYTGCCSIDGSTEKGAILLEKREKTNRKLGLCEKMDFVIHRVRVHLLWLTIKWVILILLVYIWHTSIRQLMHLYHMSSYTHFIPVLHRSKNSRHLCGEIHSTEFVTSCLYHF